MAEKNDVLQELREVELRGTLFNTLKLYLTLSVADALLRPSTLFWILAAVLMCGPYVYDPMKYPLYMGVIISVFINGGYQALIGSLRRNAQKYLQKFALTSGYDLRKRSVAELEQILEEEKAPKYSDDPRGVRLLFAFARFFGIPRRGFLHQCIAVSQYIFLGLYIFNYVHFYGTHGANNIPDMLWMMHGAVTFYGIFAVVKNSSFLLTSRVLLALVGAVLDPRGATKGIADDLANLQEKTHSAIQGSMENYRFKGDAPPPSNECETCIKEMARHVVSEVPLVLAPERTQAEETSTPPEQPKA